MSSVGKRSYWLLQYPRNHKLKLRETYSKTDPAVHTAKNRTEWPPPRARRKKAIDFQLTLPSCISSARINLPSAFLLSAFSPDAGSMMTSSASIACSSRSSSAWRVGSEARTAGRSCPRLVATPAGLTETMRSARALVSATLCV